MTTAPPVLPPPITPSQRHPPTSHPSTLTAPSRSRSFTPVLGPADHPRPEPSIHPAPSPTDHSRSGPSVRLAPGSSVLHLVRHGESTWNLAGRIQGQSAEAGGLTAAGRAQAHRTAELLAERATRPAAIIASDLIRARETAEIIAVRLGLPLEFDPQLREQHLGILEGHRLDAPVADAPTAQHAVDRLWREPFSRPSGGESIADMYARVHRALRRHATDRPGVEIVLVAHGGPIRMASTPEAPAPGVPVPRVGVDNASVTSITVG